MTNPHTPGDNGPKDDGMDALKSLLNSFDQHREAIYGSGKALSGKMGMKPGDLAEIDFGGGTSIILSAGGYVGLIDDYNKKITSIGMAAGSTVTSIDKVYGRLTQKEGYDMTLIEHSRIWGQGDDSNVLNFLVNSGIVEYAIDINEGKRSPKSGFTFRFDERTYEIERMMGSFEDGTLASALAITSGAKMLGGILRPVSENQTEIEGRIIEPFEWPKQDKRLELSR